jgi:glutamine synthetase adenylyltransferase
MKYRRGGIMDIMFAVHFLVLNNAVKHSGLLHPALDAALKALQKKKLIAKKDAAPLLRALSHAQDIQGFLRLAAELPYDPAKASPGLNDALATGCAPKKMSFKAFAAMLEKDFKAAFAVYKKVL